MTRLADSVADRSTCRAENSMEVVPMVKLCMVLLVSTALSACNASPPPPPSKVAWDLPAPTAELADGWGDVPSVPNYARTYLYLPEMLESADPFLIAVSSAGHLEPGMVWMIKVVVSAANECLYCLSQAVIMARHSGFNEGQIHAVQTDIGAADLTPKQAALLGLETSG